MKNIVLLFAILFLGNIAFAQEGKLFWSEIEESKISLKHTKEIYPEKYRLLELDVKSLKKSLKKTASRSDVKSGKAVNIKLPLPNGTNADFEVVEASCMHPELQAKYPDIRSYAAIENETGAFARFAVSPKGVHGIIFLDGEVAYIDPYTTTNDKYHLSYYKKDYAASHDFECHTSPSADAEKYKNNIDELKDYTSDCQLRTYRLALACTGEYAAFHGGTISGTMAGMNAVMTRVNGIYEKDMSITMVLVANNDELIFLNANSDPYTNNNISQMIGANQNQCDIVIGTDNYDLGHVFSTAGGGLASFASVGNPYSKASAGTGLYNPVGDPFAVDYVSHEIGHQFGADHTQNNNCQRAGTTSVEPGSGSTIMGYAGICAPNIQSRSDDYFHTVSIQQIFYYITGGFYGNMAGTATPTNNNEPIITPTPDYVVPISTPFRLTCTATDADNDPLTYCWEQVDEEVANMPPLATSNSGPSFRSYEPRSNPMRSFPSMSSIIANEDPTWEVLPSVSRTMNFTCTVRDNHLGGTCFATDDVQVNFVANAGPFFVTSPSSGVEVWEVGSSQVVTWNEADTDLPPISAEFVDILLSTDGGQTYPIVLAATVRNNGSAIITVPNNVGTDNRIMVFASGNIFFDVSDEDFEIIPCTANCNPVTTNVGAKVKIWLEGFLDQSTNLMRTELAANNLLPLTHPFNISPYNYTGTETVLSFPENAVDWVLFEVRDKDDMSQVMAQKAVFIRHDGILMDLDGNPNIGFDNLTADDYTIIVRHKSHLAVASAVPVTFDDTFSGTYDFTLYHGQALGNQQLKAVGNTYAMYCGDYDGSGIHNNLDYNTWKQQNAIVNTYSTQDGDGNGVVNNLDYNLWQRNRSKIGNSAVQY